MSAQQNQVFCRSWLGLLLLVGLMAVPGWGRDIFVATNGPGGGDPLYGTWETAASNIALAVNVGANGDTVWISNGVYVLTSQITVTSNITICGISTGSKPVVDGNNTYRCFEFTEAATAGVLSNLFITRGYANDNGGGVYMRSGTLLDCVFSNNVAGTGRGGGAYFTTGTNLVRSCTFVANTSAASAGGLCLISMSAGIIDGCTFITNVSAIAGGLEIQGTCKNILVTGCDFIRNVASGDYGGGAAFMCNSAATNNFVTRCTFVGNVVVGSGYGGGGAIFSSWTPPTEWVCSNSVFSNNISAGSGGGIHTYFSVFKQCVIACNTSLVGGVNNGGGGIYAPYDTVVQDSTIEGNTAHNGGGVYFGFGTSFTLQNCLIRNNYAIIGGGVRLYATPADLRSCTIVSNGVFGTTLWGGGIDAESSLVRVENCISYFNNPDNTVNSYDGGSSYSNCCFTPALAAGAIADKSTNNITFDPQFISPDTGNWRLTKGSPCINAGVYRAWMTGARDLDGHFRLDKFSGLPDMGCYEYLLSGSLFSFR